MKKRVSQHLNLDTLLPLTIGLWLGYLMLSLAIGYLLFARPIFPPLYYVLNALVALVVMGITIYPRVRAWLGRALLPLVVALLSITPVVLSQVLAMNQLPPAPANGPESGLLWMMPLLLMPLILLVWQHGWRSAIWFSGGIALFSLGLHIYYFRPNSPSLLSPVFVLVTQTITFLLVGYYISVLARELKQQNESLAQANSRLADHAATVEELTISRERNRMARELHDTLAHTLSALSVQLETAQAYQDVDHAVTASILETSLAATRSGLQETRQALKSLRASPLEDMGLALALRMLAAETAERADLELQLSIPTHVPSLPHAVEQCIYRVTQEATANVAHHANAHTLAIKLTFGGDIVLKVSDDGVGFDPEQAETSGHFGLAGMRERAALVGAALAVTSKQGSGTVIQMTIEGY